MIINNPQDCNNKETASTEADRISTTMSKNRKIIDKHIIDTSTGSNYIYMMDEDNNGKMLIQGMLYDDIHKRMLSVSLFYLKGTESAQINEEFISIMNSIKI